MSHKSVGDVFRILSTLEEHKIIPNIDFMVPNRSATFNNGVDFLCTRLSVFSVIKGSDYENHIKISTYELMPLHPTRFIFRYCVALSKKHRHIWIALAVRPLVRPDL